MTKSCNILLNEITKIEAFQKTCLNSKCVVDVRSMDFKKFIDAKSIMGLCSLDLSKVIHVEIRGDETDINDLYDKIKQYEVDVQ